MMCVNGQESGSLAGVERRGVCVHCGDQVDLVRCPSCRGSVKAVVRACALHGRCTSFSRKIPGAKACHACAEYVSIAINQRTEP